MWRHATNLCWWLGVSVYFGGLLTLGAIVAPSILHTAGAARVSMPGFLSPPLAMNTQVTGQFFGDILKRFAIVELVALGLMLLGLIGFLFARRPGCRVRRSAVVLLILWTILAAALAYDAGVLTPRIWSQRAVVWQTASAHVSDAAGALWPERAEFLRLHDRAETLGRIKIYLLLGMILVAAWRGLAERPAVHAGSTAGARAPLLREEV